MLNEKISDDVRGDAMADDGIEVSCAAVTWTDELLHIIYHLIIILVIIVSIIIISIIIRLELYNNTKKYVYSTFFLLCKAVLEYKYVRDGFGHIMYL